MVFNKILSKADKLIPDLKDVYDALNPLHLVCQITGLAPYKLVQKQDNFKTYERSIWTLLRCIVLLILFCAGFAVISTEQDSVFDGEIDQRLPQIQNYFIALIGLVSLLFACIFSNKIIEVFQNIVEIDKEFHELAVWMPYRRNYIAVILNLICLLLLLVTILIWVFVESPPQTMPLLTIIQLVVILPLLILVYIMESQYINYLNLLRHRYSILNEYLEALARENKCSDGWITEVVEENEEDEKISKSILKSIEIIANPILVIEKVASLHIKLSDAALSINTIFAVQFLMRITVAFISIVMALYIIGVNFSSNATESANLNVNIMFTAWAASSALELLAVVWITNATCEEANKCPRLMHKIRNATKNSKLQEVIEMYSLQLYHNRLKFHICGLFPLDYTLLHTIVAGVTTYLVILIQFYSAGSSNKTTANVSQTSKTDNAEAVEFNLTDA